MHTLCVSACVSRISCSARRHCQVCQETVSSSKWGTIWQSSENHNKGRVDLALCSLPSTADVKKLEKRICCVNRHGQSLSNIMSSKHGQYTIILTISSHVQTPTTVSMVFLSTLPQSCSQWPSSSSVSGCGQHESHFRSWLQHSLLCSDTSNPKMSLPFGTIHIKDQLHSRCSGVMLSTSARRQCTRTVIILQTSLDNCYETSLCDLSITIFIHVSSSSGHVPHSLEWAGLYSGSSWDCCICSMVSF